MSLVIILCIFVLYISIGAQLLKKRLRYTGVSAIIFALTAPGVYSYYEWFHNGIFPDMCLAIFSIMLVLGIVAFKKGLDEAKKTSSNKAHCLS